MKRRILLSAAAAAAASPSLALAANSAGRTLGLTLPLTGVQREVAADLALGFQVAIEASGSDLKIRILDDQSSVEKVAENVRLLAADPAVIAISGIVGTPHAQAAIPIAYSAGLPVVGIRSGASSLRTGQNGVFHLRSSFEDELDKLLAQCVGSGIKKMAILFSDDSFGNGSKDHLTKRMAESGVALLTAIPVERNGGNIVQACAAIAKLIVVSKEPVAMTLLLIATPMTKASAELRSVHKLVLPIFAMSFVATRHISTEPDDVLAGLGVVDAFPIPWSSGNALAGQFRIDAKKVEKPNAIFSLASFEGYFYGSVIARAAYGGVGRDALVKNLKAGLVVAGQPINFDAKQVGYSFLEVVCKRAITGRFQA